ncbi:hypothetical protein BX661DRAFT_186310 [Kickxella alabastrina]|uniref:uncharacterized protein n=1 Tax=Kickxella alabastrina TaxID=61397 RepID=UPI00221EFE53|nr:uncharacterized protein BX661DRAFT_186310 [Kickxella alabastrina]KAI7823725.1 hypothetical protein BX661DRAFT_186310 [Kickxella alabastrina]
MHQHDWRLVAASRTMALLHAANQLLPCRSRLPVDAFYSLGGVDNMDLVADYDAWQARVPGAFSFCQYPFLLSLRAKVQIMQVDAARQMDSKVKEAVISALFQNSLMASQPYLKLFIRRKCLVEDSLNQLATHEQDLKKRLKIEFVGEEGVDAGGLAKEWFMLLVRDLLNPLYGLFVCDAEDGKGTYWFNPAALETSNRYFLVGVVVGLALYNSTLLDLHLPLAVFKKLLYPNFYHTPQHSSSVLLPMAVVAAATAATTTAAASNGHAPADGSAAAQRYGAASNGTGGSAGFTGSASAGGMGDGRSPIYGLLSSSAQVRYQINEMLSDVGHFRPDLARGLRQLLQYRETDVEQVFSLTFEASYDAYGETITVPLIPQGAHVPVTSHNRVEYVMRYLQWVLNDSVARQFEPFKRGFYYVCGGNALSLFRPEEIELMVNGSGEDWDSKMVRKMAEQVGFEDGVLVEWVWAVLDEMKVDERRLFLLFVTGTDRLPMVSAGAAGLKLKIMFLGDDWRRLPVAHTCFNQLGVWKYRSKDEMRHKIMLAIKESEGFGLK